MERFVDVEFKGLTYFDVGNISFTERKSTEQASNFVKEREYGDTKLLYLELNSFLLKKPDYVLYTEFDVPVFYSTELIRKWVEYDCGNGLYSFLSNDFYADDLKLSYLTARQVNQIKKACTAIDQQRYSNLDFGPELLSKLGTQLESDILPNLLELQEFLDQGLSEIIKYLFTISALLIIFGVALPIINKIYEIGYIVDIISVSVTLATCFYLLSSFYQFMRKEIVIYKPTFKSR